MAIYCDEDQMGRDAATIGFPHLLLCMGVVVRTANDIWGVHLGTTEESGTTFAAFWNYATAKGLAAASVTEIYTSCNLAVRYGGASSAAARLEIWKGEVTGYAGVMHWQGNVHRFDTGILAPTDGTYVEYQHQTHGVQGCRIFYKKNEKTQSTGAVVVNSAGGTADFVGFDHHQNGLRAMAVMKTGVVVTSPGGIRELDYANRLVTYAVT